MNILRVRPLLKKLTPFVLAGVALGTAGAAAQRYFASDCCAPGSSCCHPGAACCHGHQQGLAQR